MKILHLSFHKGCINDFNYVCKQLKIQCEVLSSIKECNTNQTLASLALPDNQHYNITDKKAKDY